jgi:hypothetical protein
MSFTQAKLVRRAAPMTLEVAASQAGLHPELAVRLVRIGLIDPVGGTRDAPLFAPDTPAHLARAARLRRDLGLGYAGAILASQLLDRIEHLEARLRDYER